MVDATAAPKAVKRAGLVIPRDANYMPSWPIAIPLAAQHILAMFVSNVTPAIIVAGAAGFGYGSSDLSDLVYLIQVSMVFAGIATLFQTVGIGPMGARLPIVQGTSFAFLPIMVPLVAGQGVEAMAALMTGALAGGLFHAFLSLFVKRLRFALPPLITGLVVMMIGLSLVPVGIQYAAGGAPLLGTDAFGSGPSWLLACVVIVVTLAFKFFGRGMSSTAAVLIGLIAGYGVAFAMGEVDFSPISSAGWVIVPTPFPFGISLTGAAISGFCLMAVVSAIETVGDVSAVTKSGLGREATDNELRGATLADGAGTALAAVFGAMPNSSFSQNVGLVAMTGVVSRHVVTIGAVFLIVCGMLPKIGAVITTIPIEVLGGSVIIMFGMVAGAGLSILSEVNWNQRNMLIFAVSLSVGLGLQLVPEAVQHIEGTARILLTSGVLPAAFIAVLLNLLLPHSPDLLEEQAPEPSPKPE